jgi:hypothetical protein
MGRIAADIENAQTRKMFAQIFLWFCKLLDFAHNSICKDRNWLI